MVHPTDTNGRPDRDELAAECERLRQQVAELRQQNELLRQERDAIAAKRDEYRMSLQTVIRECYLRDDAELEREVEEAIKKGIPFEGVFQEVEEMFKARPEVRLDQ